MGPATKDRYDILLLSRSEARPGSYQKLARTYEKLLAKADLLCDGQDWDQG